MLKNSYFENKTNKQIGKCKQFGCFDIYSAGVLKLARHFTWGLDRFIKEARATGGN